MEVKKKSKNKLYLLTTSVAITIDFLNCHPILSWTIFIPRKKKKKKKKIGLMKNGISAIL